MAYGDNGESADDSRPDRFAVMVGLVLGGAVTALIVSTAVGLAIGAGLYDTPPCHECEGCNP